MEYVKLGLTGLDVSRICLGCMSFGLPDRGTHTWSLDEEASRPLIRRALDAGITRGRESGGGAGGTVVPDGRGA
ncbi:hypothetical protein ACWDAZ_41145, partial [Streptomyces sp. NPDC001215]